MKDTLMEEVSPKHNGSTLYDSYELRAVTKQLNRAIQGPNAPLSPYSYYIKSPFYRKRLDRIYRQNAKSPKRISSSSRRVGSEKDDVKKEGLKDGGSTGFAVRLWKRVKRGLLWKI